MLLNDHEQKQVSDRSRFNTFQGHRSQHPQGIQILMGTQLKYLKLKKKKQFHENKQYAPKTKL